MKNNLTNPTAAIIQKKLNQALAPTFLDIIDEGDQHLGHAEEGAGHFAVRIASPLFKNKPLVECHRLVYAALGDSMRHGIHALRIDIIQD
ncbi:MAG: BolA family transcriptional regulator [Gammaproteobacteria bacterium]|nr:MAG: BolA family transcriptional regulator [Gammaproteobacteria bacterium]